MRLGESKTGRVLSVATQHDLTEKLYWTVSIDRGLSAGRGGTAQWRYKTRWETATLADGSVPALRVGPDPHLSRLLAEVMAGVLRWRYLARPGYEQAKFGAELTPIEELGKHKFFEWGEG